MTSDEKNREREMRFSQGDESAADRASRVRGVNARMAKDARQFVRAGFKELDYQSGGWLYITKGAMMASPLLTHEAALAHPLKVAAEASADDAPAGKDAVLLKFLVQNLGYGGDGARPAVLAQIDILIGQGANPTQARVLHCCAASDAHQLFQPLIARGADVNGKDDKGSTPLMVAAAAAIGETNPIHNPSPSAQAVSALIALGADKNITNQGGRTALGFLYCSLRNHNDFNAALIGGPKTTVDPTLQAMLMPSAGPTVADEECKDDHV
jgi:hypothetical protein